MKIELIVENITEENKKDKFLKAISELSSQLKLPTTIEKRESHKEEYPFIAQEELYKKNILEFGNMMDELYSRLCSTLGMKPANTFRKAIDPNAPTLGKEILWNPETKKQISQKDLDKLLKLIDKFMNQRLNGREFTISQSAVARIIANLRKEYSFDALRKIPLDDLKYKNHKIDYFNSFKKLKETFPLDIERLLFKERVIGNHIQDITESTRKKIRNTLDNGYLAGKTKSQISQELFDNFGSLNKDWDRIVETESSNIFNSEYIDEQKKDVQHGEDLYFIRHEFNDSKTCKFCQKANEEPVIAKWSEVPLQDDKIKDPVASIAIWQGKTNIGRSRSDWWWAESSVHPLCRGIWDRYYEEGELNL